MTDAQFIAWLKDHTAIRCVLVEVNVKTGGVETTRFLSNKGYVTSPTDTPANTRYSPFIIGGVKFTETISLEGTASLSFGDIEIDNMSGDRDTWLDDVWDNRAIKVFIGDVRWPRTDFRQIFDGVVAGIQTKNRTRFNLKVSDKLQRLNGPISETKLGGSTSNADRLIPLCFGECHNIEPLLIDPATNEYQVHDGPIENIIEVRDNGVPVAFTPFLSTGKFRLTSQPSGQVTCSVQGAYYTQNVVWYSGALDNSSWAKSRCTVPVTKYTAPDGTLSAQKITEDSTTGNHYIDQRRNITTGAGNPIVWSAYVKAGERTSVTLSSYSDPTTSQNLHTTFDLTTGTITARITNATRVSEGIVDVGNGWWRIWHTVEFASADNKAYFRIQLQNGGSYLGDGASGAYVWKPQGESGVIPSKQTPTTTAAANAYWNTVADLVNVLATRYGTADTRFSGLELDADQFVKFNFDNPQPVGLYVKDRMNVIEALNNLAASVGGRVLINRSGKLSILKLTLPQATAGRTVTPTDIVHQSLHVSQLPKVEAGCQIGYCKNWTVQSSNIAAGVPVDHADLYSQEWLTYTAKDTLTAADYKTFSEPAMEETLLLANADAVAEASRRLNMWNVQRKVYKYTGMPWLMLEELGASQTLTNPRFGLQNGKTGQIISLATDWLDPHITVEILI